MKANQLRSVSSHGATSSLWNHASPKGGIERLIPALIHMDKIELEPIHRSSADFINRFASAGGRIDEYPFKYYREQTLSGVTRAFDNSDLIKGKEPVWGDLPTLLHLLPSIRSLVKDMIAYYDEATNHSLIAQMENEDLTKITIQQWKPTGYFVNNQICDNMVPATIPLACKKILRVIASQYAKKAGLTDLRFTPLCSMDDDPPDTMTGVPTLASGGRTHQARLATLRACPPPGNKNWWMQLDVLGASMGLTPGLIYSPVLSTRFGPLRKPTPLYSRQGSGYIASYQALGAYNRVRFVYPAPYHVNFALSPLYVWMSSARKNILGLWHTPTLRDKYIAHFRSQGAVPYAVDFSGMDTAMWENIIMEILAALQHVGAPEWPTEMFQAMYPRMGVSIPSIYGVPGSASYITGRARPWCSGFKLTSEFDTIYGLAVVLSSLSEQIPDIVQQWIDGKFVLGELGDDVCFTLPKEIDTEKLAASALRNWGATLKLNVDCVFLKWFLPLHKDVPKLTRPISRFIQQTFFNEDRYSGIEGGAKPDAILRLGTGARIFGLVDHPDIRKWWPRIWTILQELPYVRSSDAAWKAAVSRCTTPPISSEDAIAILKYAEAVPSYLGDIYERSKYESSAATLVNYLQSAGVKDIVHPPSPLIRKAYLEAFLATPTPTDVRELIKLAKPNYV